MTTQPRLSERTMYELWDELERERSRNGESAAVAMATRAFRAALGLPIITDAAKSGTPRADRVGNSCARPAPTGE